MDGLDLAFAHPGAYAGEDLLPDLVGVRVLPESVEQLHLLLSDLGSGELQDVRAAAEPAPGRVALGGVVVGRALPRLALNVAAGDLAGEVGVAVSGGEFVQGQHRLLLPFSPGRAVRCASGAIRFGFKILFVQEVS